MKGQFIDRKQPRMISFMVVLFLFLSFIGWKEAAAEVKNLKWSIFMAETAYSSPLAAEMARAIETYTEGAVKIKVYWLGQIADTKELPELCKRGSIEMTSTTPIHYTSIFPINSSLQYIPGLFKTVEHAQYVWRGLMREAPAVQDEFAKQNQYCLNRASLSAYHLISRKPVRSPADFKDLKLRTWPGKHFSRIIQEYRAIPMMLEVSELYEGLMRGTVDAAMINTPYADSLKLSDVAKYMSINVGAIPGWYTSINLDVWKSLSPKIQNAFTKAATEWGTKDMDLNLTLDQKSTENLKAKGVQFVDFPQKDWDAMIARGGDPWEALKNSLTSDLNVDPAVANGFVNRWHELSDEFEAKYLAAGKQWKYE
jgi:TRAP-type transport system periplasmic protein